MYVVTGGAGFIGSAFISRLNSEGIDNILVVDNLGESDKWKNLIGKRFSLYLNKDEFLKLLVEKKLSSISSNDPINAIIHMGACSSTMERNVEYLIQNNFKYTRLLAEYAIENRIRFIYASSAATYGAGEQGYSDEHEIVPRLRPLNAYGYSKQLFDEYALRHKLLNQIVGLKFFNVFGPNEYHKEEMRSVVHKAYLQVKTTGAIKLFKSYHPDFKDGDQKRDFIYVKECTKVMFWFLKNPRANGLFNVGSGRARTWNVLARSVFTALNMEPVIEYIDMPDNLRRQYQYFTQADIKKLNDTPCPTIGDNLQENIRDYIVNHLETANPYL
jgi:ADP-L-glycero-D-manno-heptose 6-epimerase